MKKDKLKLQDLRVQSFLTELNEESMQQVKGGFFIIRGRRFNFKVRWTSVDTRVNQDEGIAGIPSDL